MSAEHARALVSEGATVPTAEQRARSECGKHKEVEREGNGRFSLSLCCQSMPKCFIIYINLINSSNDTKRASERDACMHEKQTTQHTMR